MVADDGGGEEDARPNLNADNEGKAVKEGKGLVGGGEGGGERRERLVVKRGWIAHRSLLINAPITVTIALY